MSSQKNKNVMIDIKNSPFSFDDIANDEKDKILQLNKNKKTELIKKIEKSQIKYMKCNYACKNELSYECKKLIDIPENIIEPNNKIKLFLRLINYNKKNIFFFGYSHNLLIYEIFDNNIYTIYSVFQQ